MLLTQQSSPIFLVLYCPLLVHICHRRSWPLEPNVVYLRHLPVNSGNTRLIFMLRKKLYTVQYYKGCLQHISN